MGTRTTQSTNLKQAIANYVAALWSRREFAWYMAMGNLRARNASTSLGLLWWVVNPLLQGAVYYLVFGVILGISRDLSHLLSGIFVFYYTSTSITTGANSIIQNRSLLVNLNFPRLILPVTAITEAGVGFLTSIPALFVIIGTTQGVWPTTQLLWLFPVIFVVQSLFNLGLATLTARITVPFRDVTNLLPHLLRVWFYMSPILYAVSRYEGLSDTAQSLFLLNPMVPLLSVYRSALLGTTFVPRDLMFASAWGFGVAAFAIIVFVKYEGKMARYL
ncbi:MAG: ABC transporter permease [Actinomycetota bacterium]|nr:ABC transporter permease [Actinomycetota bacterium]